MIQTVPGLLKAAGLRGGEEKIEVLYHLSLLLSVWRFIHMGSVLSSSNNAQCILTLSSICSPVLFNLVLQQIVQLQISVKGS